MNKLIKSLVLSFVVFTFLGTSLPTFFVSSSDTLSIGVEKAWAKQQKKKSKKRRGKKKSKKKNGSQPPEPPVCIPPGCVPDGGGGVL